MNMAKLSKKQFDKTKERLTLTPKSVWEQCDAAGRKKIMALAEDYKEFLNQARTERMAVEAIQAAAAKKGFKPHKPGTKSKKLIFTFRSKVAALAVLGKKPVSRGVRLIGAHIDAPRLDFKMRPLYEDQELAFLKTQYYGGIKKYQWLARPMALHGVLCKTDGSTVEVHIGDRPEDPVFTIMDLLPHLSRKVQSTKKVSEAFTAERMNLLIAGLPLDSDQKGKKVKLAVLQFLEDAYGVSEADLISAELQAVPAGPPRDVGLDRSMVGGYGQDDRISAFSALDAVLGVTRPEATCLALFVDKEETGSDGSTGARSRFIEHLLADITAAGGEEPNWRNVSRALMNTRALSADVNAAFDPDFPEVHEKRNAAFLGYGVNLTKYTGSGGKYGASDANAEYLAWIRKIWDEAKVTWQAAGMGKIDEGGGGTIAKLLAVYGMEIVDAGPALLNMHSPFEICHKADLYSTVQAFKAFFQAKGE
jgi:aspartyl aminopeptidase